MYPWNREYALRAVTFVVIAFSALMIAEYAGRAPALCSPGGGCDTVKSSGYAYPLGIPLPVLGVAFYSLVLALAVWPRWRRSLAPVAMVGAAGGLAFIGIQVFEIGALCWMCLTVDLGAIAIGALAWSLRKHTPPAPSPLGWALQGGALAALIGGGFVAHAVAADNANHGLTIDLPAAIQSEQVDDKVTIVEFFDFRCPHCRELHAHMKPVLAEYGDKVALELKPLPLSRASVPPALAYCCAEEMGAGDAMANLLFTTTDHDPASCISAAEGLGLDRAVFESCLLSEDTQAKLAANRELATSVEVRGLPTFWIGDERFEGSHDSDALKSSIERALRRM